MCLHVHCRPEGRRYKSPSRRRCHRDSHIARFAEIEVAEMREDSSASFRKLTLDSAATVVLLDDEGKHQTSSQFAKWLGETRDRGAREIIFLCGSAEGFPDALRQRATQKLSLSSLTF